MKITLNRWDEYGRFIELREQAEGRDFHVSVFQDTSLDDMSPNPVKINWASFGAVTPATALVMSRLMAEAARLAGEMEKVESWDRITPPMEGGRWKGEGRPQVNIQDGRAWVDSEGWEVPDAEG